MAGIEFAKRNSFYSRMLARKWRCKCKFHWLFINGVPLKIDALYPKIEFPVSRGTPRISPLIKWDHDYDWPNLISERTQSDVITKDIVIDASDEKLAYLKDHVVDGRSLISGFALVYIVGETLCSTTVGSSISALNVEFKDVKFLSPTFFEATSIVTLTVSVHLTTGHFEITESNTLVATGVVSLIKDPTPVSDLRALCTHADSPVLDSKEFCKAIGLRGYKPRGLFQAVHSACLKGCCGQIKWKNNWVTFMDCMCQLALLSANSSTLKIASSVRYIKINAVEHMKWLSSLGNENDEKICDVYYSEKTSTVVCGGVEVAGVKKVPLERRKQEGVEVLESYRFVPLVDPSIEYDLDDAVTICVQLAIETLQTKQVKLVEVVSDDATESMIEYFHSAFTRTPIVLADLTLLTNKKGLPLPTNIKCENSTLEHHTECNFVVITRCSNRKELFQLANKSLAEDGYLLLVEDSEMNHESVNIPNGLTLISVIRSSEATFALMQRIQTGSEAEGEMKVISVNSNDCSFEWLKQVQEATEATNVLLVAQNDKTTGVLGLIKCLRLEPDSSHFRCLIIDDPRAPQFTIDNQFYAAQLALKMPINVYRNGKWGTYRHLTLKPKTRRENSTNWLHVDIERRGDLETLKWVPSIKEMRFESDSVKVQYSGITFRDVMIATGKLPQSVVSESRTLEYRSAIGCEFAGVTSNGKRVMGMCASGQSLTTFVDISKCDLVLNVPDAMTLRDAATIPFAYGIVYYAFLINSAIRSGQSILIHCGSGGVGMAAIRVALAFGLRVFTTVSSEEKREFLLKHFPQLQVSDIGNSRDCSFGQLIMARTGCKGVDFVLNSLADEKLKASIRCLGADGTFLEIGKFNIVNNSNFELNAFERGITFRTIFVDKLVANPLVCKQVVELMERDLHRGIIQPLPSKVFAAEYVEGAFRYIAAGRHVGKVLLQIRELENSENSLPVTVTPKVIFNSSLVYIIVGGLGGFGMELVDWMVRSHGARKIVLNSRRGVTNAYQQYRIKSWKSYGCEIIINKSDAATLDGCMKLLTESMRHGHIGGIFNLAAVLRDGILANQTAYSFGEAFAPKVMVTHHFDSLSRKMCPNLEYFIVFSSLVCGRGNSGQTNYGMANSVMERIIEQRLRDKLPAKAFQWGPIDDVGIVADWDLAVHYSQLQGTVPQRIHRCLFLLDELLTCGEPIVSSLQLGQKQALQKLDLVTRIFRTLGISNHENISINSTLSELGLDSLMSTELKKMLQRELGISLDSNELKALTVAKLNEYSKK